MLVVIRGILPVSELSETDKAVYDELEKFLIGFDYSASDYEKAKRIYEEITERAVYHEGKYVQADDEVYNILVTGRGKCVGFARTYKLFANAVGLKCVFLEDGAHMWNGVYLLPVEDCNFDPAKPVWSTDSRENGITSPLENRLLGFVHRDMAVPTLYKNDQLVYVSDGSISVFTWERFRDCGYSIGFSGLVLSESSKIKSDPQTACCEGSSLKATLKALALGKDTDVTIDAINATALSPQYLNSTGIITGMSKGTAANVDLYLDIQHTPISISADTKYYQSFELYKTAKYALSTDGYVIVEVPAYFRSGYYLINNMGFVKFLNVDRGR